MMVTADLLVGIWKKRQMLDYATAVLLPLGSLSSPLASQLDKLIKSVTLGKKVNIFLLLSFSSSITLIGASRPMSVDDKEKMP